MPEARIVLLKNMGKKVLRISYNSLSHVRWILEYNFIRNLKIMHFAAPEDKKVNRQWMTVKINGIHNTQNNNSYRYLTVYRKILQIHLHISKPKKWDQKKKFKPAKRKAEENHCTVMCKKYQYGSITKILTSLNAPIRGNTLVSLLIWLTNSFGIGVLKNTYALERKRKEVPFVKWKIMSWELYKI